MITIKSGESKKVNGEYSLFVSFPYDADTVNLMRSFPSRYWHKETKEWELPYNKQDTLLSELDRLGKRYKADIQKIEQKTVSVPSDFSFKTKPFSHQKEAFEFGLVHDRWFLGDEMGLGKSKESIDLAVEKKLERGYQHCLIVCGVNSLKWNWVNEVKTHSNESAWILGQRKNKSGKLTIGSNTQKLDDLKNIDAINQYFLITNVESLRNEKITEQLKKLCKSGKINMIIADEIHKIKNTGSQQGKAFLKLQPEYRLAMTGTPLMNTPLDLFVILKWLGYEKHSNYVFKRHYCEFGGFGGYEVVGYRNLDELQERLDEIMLRRRKEDVLDLPEKIYIDEYVDMTPKQKVIYDEITDDIRLHIDEIKMANNPLAELIRMRQATGYTGILSSTIQESAKLDRMEELVEEAVSNGKKVVIFSNWSQMTDVVRARLARKYKGVAITGQTKDVDRQVNVYQFQNNPDCKYIVGTIGAMGTGLTLTAGTVEIFLDEPWNRANKEQAEDRCHRVGTTENITIYTIMCKDTIDERINSIVQKKGAMSDAIVDGKVKQDKRQLLEYLIN